MAAIYIGPTIVLLLTLHKNQEQMTLVYFHFAHQSTAVVFQIFCKMKRQIIKKINKNECIDGIHLKRICVRCVLYLYWASQLSFIFSNILIFITFNIELSFPLQ